MGFGRNRHYLWKTNWTCWLVNFASCFTLAQLAETSENSSAPEIWRFCSGFFGIWTLEGAFWPFHTGIIAFLVYVHQSSSCSQYSTFTPSLKLCYSRCVCCIGPWYSWSQQIQSSCTKHIRKRRQWQGQKSEQRWNGGISKSRRYLESECPWNWGWWSRRHIYE